MQKEPLTIAANIKKNDYSYFILYSASQHQYFAIIEKNTDIPQELLKPQEEKQIPISVIPFLDQSTIDFKAIDKIHEEDANNSKNLNSLVSLFDIFYDMEFNNNKNSKDLPKLKNEFTFNFTQEEYAKAIYGISQAFCFAAKYGISLSLTDIFFDKDKLPHVAFCTPLLKENPEPEPLNYNINNDQCEYIYKPEEAKMAFGNILYLLAFLTFSNKEDEDDDDFFLNDDDNGNESEDIIDGENLEFEDEPEQENENDDQNNIDFDETQTPQTENQINIDETQTPQTENQAENDNNNNNPNENENLAPLTEKEDLNATSNRKSLFNIPKILQIFQTTHHIISPPFELFPSFIDGLVDRCMCPTVPFEWIIDQISLNIEFIIEHGRDAEAINDPTTRSMVQSFNQYIKNFQYFNENRKIAKPNDDDEVDDDDVLLRPPAAAPGTFRSFVVQEDLPFKMDPWIYCQTQSIIDLQAILMDTTEETLEENISIFLESIYRHDMQLIDSFVHYIIIAVFHRPKCIKTITLLVKGIIDACMANNENENSEDGIEYAVKLKEAILRMTPEKPASSGHWANASGPMNFLYECYKIGIFDEGEMFRLIRSLTTAKGIDENSNQTEPSQYNSDLFSVRRVGAHLTAYMAPQMAKIDIQFLAAIVHHVIEYNGDFPNAINQTFSMINEIIESIGTNMNSNFDDKVWEPLEKLIYDAKGIREILQRDDIDSLREMAANPSFDINMRVKPSLFDPYFIAADKPTLLQYSAFHSALKCFRYLLLNGADTKSQDTISRTVVHYAIDGGSIEIIRICEQEGLNFDGALEESVKMYQFDIFEWLQGTKYPVLPINNLKYGSIPVNAARTNNIRMILFSLENGLDINASDQYDSFPLCLASLFGYNDVIRLLLTSPNIEVNKQDRQGDTSLLTAVDAGYIDTVRLLLSHKDIDIVLSNNGGVF